MAGRDARFALWGVEQCGWQPIVIGGWHPDARRPVNATSFQSYDSMCRDDRFLGHQFVWLDPSSAVPLRAHHHHLGDVIYVVGPDDSCVSGRYAEAVALGRVANARYNIGPHTLHAETALSAVLWDRLRVA